MAGCRGELLEEIGVHFQGTSDLFLALALHAVVLNQVVYEVEQNSCDHLDRMFLRIFAEIVDYFKGLGHILICLLYTSDAADD